MSSIDKGVRTVAQGIDPRVTVVNDNGWIKGYINGRVIFTIKDRYGYVNAQEEATVLAGINAYREAQEAERRRRAEEAERQRKAAVASVKAEATKALQSLKVSYERAVASFDEATKSANLAEQVRATGGEYNLDGLTAKATEIESEIQEKKQRLLTEYNQKKAEIENISRGITGSSSAEAAGFANSRLRAVSTHIFAQTPPNKKIEAFKDQLTEIRGALRELTQIRKELGAYATTPEAKKRLKEATGLPINSKKDVLALSEGIREAIEAIKASEFEKGTKETSDKIKSLEGMLEKCYQIEGYTKISTYESITFEEEIEVKASLAIKAYEELEVAEYTTCTDQRLIKCREEIQDILTKNNGDSQQVKRLDMLIDEAQKYKQADQSLAPAYNRYKQIKQMFEELGIYEIEKFDPSQYEKQQDKLSSELYVEEKRRIISASRVSLQVAGKVMEEMGYKLISYNIGQDEEGDESLTCEAVYGIPGCDDVVWKIYTTEKDIERKLVGVAYDKNGTATSHERIKEVGRVFEGQNEGITFIQKIQAETELGIEVFSAADADDANADAVLDDTQPFVIPNDEVEKSFKEIVGKTEKQELKTKQTVTTVKINKIVDRDKDRKRRSTKRAQAAKKKCS